MASYQGLPETKIGAALEDTEDPNLEACMQLGVNTFAMSVQTVRDMSVLWLMLGMLKAGCQCFH